MQSLILAAGYATRLYPLTLNTPKPLLPVKGRCMIDYLTEKINVLSEVENIYVVTNDRFCQAFSEWKNSAYSKKRVTIINDHTPNNDNRLGAIGDINFVLEQEEINDDLLVIAGDNLFDFSLADFVSFFKQKRASVLAVYDTHDKQLIAKKLGCLELDDEQRITSFNEKPEHPTTTLAATACYLFTQEDLALLKQCLKDKQRLDNSGDFVSYLISKKPVYGFTFSGKWHDIGTKEQYELVK